ncbi:MAG TPA: hypothetical protein VF304_17395 [Casimicrobiaceae bacterium]
MNAALVKAEIALACVDPARRRPARIPAALARVPGAHRPTSGKPD